MYCKTFAGDYKVFEKLVESFKNYNRDGICLVISCPEEDWNLFEKFIDNNIIVISDESYAAQYFVEKEVLGFSKGYINQEICKLAFSELNLACNYLCLDSDAFFIRDFYIQDFMFDENIPYSVLTMDKELACEKEYQFYWDFREKQVKKIFDFLDYKTSLYKTCHNMQIMNSEVVARLKEYCLEKNFLFKDMIEYSPFEFSWYNAALQKFKVIPVIEVEPFFKMFHIKEQYKDARRHCMGLDDWKRQYIGICMNSNWTKKGEGYKNPGIIDKVIYRLRKVANKI